MAIKHGFQTTMTYSVYVYKDFIIMWSCKIIRISVSTCVQTIIDVYASAIKVHVVSSTLLGFVRYMQHFKYLNFLLFERNFQAS